MRTVSMGEALDAVLAEAEAFEKTAKISVSPDQFFVHVKVPPNVAENLKAVQRQVLPDRSMHKDLDHVTLVYTKRPDDDHKPETVYGALDALHQVGQATEPINAKIQGWAYFDGARHKGQPSTALVALVDAPGLEHLHVDMKRALQGTSIKPSDLHGFTPHITFGYLGHKGRVPGELPPIDGWFTIDKVHVAARNHHEIPLNGMSMGQKAAASALRSRIRMESSGGKSIATLFGKPVGALNVTDGHVGGAAIDPAFQDLGLGKKLYGETIRRQPGTTLRSDAHGTSDSAQRVWEGMRARPGYNVEVTPGYENRGTTKAPSYRPARDREFPEAPHIFSASLPAATQLPRAPRASSDVREGVKELFERAHIGGGSRPPLDPLYARINARAGQKTASMAYHGSPTGGLETLEPRHDPRTGETALYMKPEEQSALIYALLADRSKSNIDTTTHGGKFVSGHAVTPHPLLPEGFLYGAADPVGQKAAASVDALQAALKRIPYIRTPARLSGAGMQIPTIPQTRHLLGDRGARAFQDAARAFEQIGVRPGAILLPQGGASRVLEHLPGVPALSGPGRKAVNIATGIHEGFERSVPPSEMSFWNKPPGGHRSPSVLINEHNLLSKMTGPGADEARQAFQALRQPLKEQQHLQQRFVQTYGPDANQFFEEGARIPAAMRRDLLKRRGYGIGKAIENMPLPYTDGRKPWGPLKTAAPQGFLPAIRERGLGTVLKEYLNHSAMNAGQASRDLLNPLDYPIKPPASNRLEHSLRSLKERTKSFANNAYYTAIPPHSHHEREDFLVPPKLTGARDHFLYGYAPWDHPDPRTGVVRPPKIASDDHTTKSLHGLDFKIDRPQGYTKHWANSGTSFTYPTDYGYLPGHRGEDGDDLDVFVGSDPHGHNESFLKGKRVLNGKIVGPEHGGKIVPDETKFLVGVSPEERKKIFDYFRPDIVLKQKIYKTPEDLKKGLAKFKVANTADPEQLARMRASLTQFLASRGLPADAPHTVIAGGAMYGHGLRPKFDDVDVLVPGLSSADRVDEPHAGLKVDAGRDFRLGDREMTQAVMDAATRHSSGLNFMSPAHILEFKQYMDRPKDQADIATLQQHLAKTAASAADLVDEFGRRAKAQGLHFFATAGDHADGASAFSASGESLGAMAARNARQAHMGWERQNGIDPHHERHAADKIPGGLSDNKKPSDFSTSALAKGIKVEMEHTSERPIATEIAMDHLTEDPMYYDKLEKIEKKASDMLKQSLGIAAAKFAMMNVRHPHDLTTEAGRAAARRDVTSGNDVGEFNPAYEEKLHARLDRRIAQKNDPAAQARAVERAARNARAKFPTHGPGRL